jgi:hypothetical protein
VPLNDWFVVLLEPEAEVAGSDVEGDDVEGDWDDWLELELDGDCVVCSWVEVVVELEEDVEVDGDAVAGDWAEGDCADGLFWSCCAAELDELD